MKEKRHTWIAPAVSGVVVVGLVAALLLKSSQTATLDKTASEVKTPISFTAHLEAEDRLQVVAQTDAYILYANLHDPAIRLLRRADGAAVDSRPAALDTLPDLKAAVKMELSSLLNIRYADRDSNIAEVNSAAGCVSRGNVAARIIEGGVRFDYYFANEGFLVPLELTLKEQGLQASVPLDEIKEASPSVKLTDIILLPNFGAGLANTEGYVLVPDGSGAILPFAYSLTSYSQRIYGEDAAVGKTVGSVPTQTARLPVFGITNKAAAVVGIITEGDARARVAAKTATARSPFTTVSAECIFRERLLVDISQRTFESTQASMFEPDRCRLKAFTVEYRMPDTADYVGMANAYRRYLIEAKGMTVSAASPALQVQMIGGVMHEENLLGIPVDRVLPVTAYEDVLSLTAALRQRGVNDLSLCYLYWYQNGTESRLTSDMKAESRLGGDDGLRSLLARLPENVSLYFDLNFTDLMHGQKGYSTLFSTAQNVKKEPLIRTVFYLSTYRRRTDAPNVFLLSPDRFEDLVSQWGAAYRSRWKPAGMTRLSLGSMGETIYSHFGNDPVDRGSAQALWERTLAAVAAESESGLLFRAANAYALPYASTVQNIPVEHSRLYCEERAVPFYAIALHGLVDMSVPPVNAGESRRRVLQAVESGVGLTYTLGWQNTDQLKNTAGEPYHFIGAADWLDSAAEQHRALLPYLQAVRDQKIVAHEPIADGVYRTEFQNGAWAIVNFTDVDYAASGGIVPAEGYLTGGY